MLWDKWNHLPWKVFKDPSNQWLEMPTFLLIEYMTFFMVIMSFIHACKNGNNHILIWMASFITGSANDIFFMALPLVDNFWQAQATVMITPRLPLYICCVYNLFMYYSVVLSWRVGYEHKWPEALVTGILALTIYYPYDLIGAKHLWWTWHTTDPAIRNRIMGVPIGSSLWILTFSASFSILLYLYRGKLKLNLVTCLILSALTTTPLMMLIMSILQFISLETQGEPSLSGLVVCCSVFVIGIIIFSTLLLDTKQSFKWIEHRTLVKFDMVLGVALLCYYIILLIAGNGFEPENMRSEGIHQTFGPCNITQMDFTGLTRDKYACHGNLLEEWNFEERISSSPNVTGSDTTFDWYTICGTKHNGGGHLWKIWLNIVCTASLMIYIILCFIMPIIYRNRRIIKKHKKSS